MAASATQKLIAILAAAGVPTILIAALLGGFLTEQCPPSGPMTSADSVLSQMVTHFEADTAFSMKAFPDGQGVWTAIRAFDKDGFMSDPSEAQYVFKTSYRLFFASDSDSLLWWWPFFEGGGTTLKDIKRGVLGTMVGGPLWTSRNAPNEFAMMFDGVNDKIALPPIDAEGTKLRIELWVWPDTAPDGGSAYLIFKGTGTTSQSQIIWCLSQSNNTSLKWRLKTGTTTGEVLANNVLTLRTWQHVVATYDGKKMRLFVNGILKGSTFKNGNVVIDRAVAVTIGDATTGGKRFKGKLDDVKIGRKLTP
jgi:hypothetical protein